MKTSKTIFGIAAVLSAYCSYAAIPTLSDLATSLATLRERLENATNETTQLRTRFAAVTNSLAKFEAVANMSRETRRAFHGGDPTSRFETNLVTKIIQRVDAYPDGYEWLVPGGVRYHTPEEMAEMIARRKATAGNLSARIAALQAQMAALEQQAQSTNRLEAAKAVIALDAAQRRLARLTATAGTNEVSVTVTPGGGN